MGSWKLGRTGKVGKVTLESASPHEPVLIKHILSLHISIYGDLIQPRCCVLVRKFCRLAKCAYTHMQYTIYTFCTHIQQMTYVYFWKDKMFAVYATCWQINGINKQQSDSCATYRLIISWRPALLQHLGWSGSFGKTGRSWPSQHTWTKDKKWQRGSRAGQMLGIGSPGIRVKGESGSMSPTLTWETRDARLASLAMPYRISISLANRSK